MSKTSILVVDDNPAIRGLYSAVLARAGYDVYAADSVQALDGLASRRLSPNLIVTDLSMPVVDGMALTRWTRSRPWLSDVPVVAITGQYGDDLRQEAFSAGCCAFLSKPVPNQTLLDTVRVCVRRV